MGLHLGDLIVDGDDIFGDGVNAAARLQEIAPPGGICISSRVHDDVRDRLGTVFDDSGMQTLKNIARPVQVWRRQPGTAEPPKPAPAPTVLPLPDKPSIAVLPFQNMSGDPEQDYFADGMVEEIITALSRTKALFVIARNSSFAYKGKSPDIRQVGQELGVRYVLEGSVRKAGNRVRITGQLIDAATPMPGERGLVTQDNWSKGGTMVTDKAIVTLVLGVFVTLVSASAGQAETRFYYCKQTMQHDRNANEPSGIDPVQLNFVVKDGAFSMGEVRFNGKVSIGETEVTAFVDNVRYEGFVNLLHTSPTAAELTMSIMDKALSQPEPKVTTGTCGVQLR